MSVSFADSASSFSTNVGNLRDIQRYFNNAVAGQIARKASLKLKKKKVNVVESSKKDPYELSAKWIANFLHSQRMEKTLFTANLESNGIIPFNSLPCSIAGELRLSSDGDLFKQLWESCRPQMAKFGRPKKIVESENKAKRERKTDLPMTYDPSSAMRRNPGLIYVEEKQRKQLEMEKMKQREAAKTPHSHHHSHHHSGVGHHKHHGSQVRELGVPASAAALSSRKSTHRHHHSHSKNGDSSSRRSSSRKEASNDVPRQRKDVPQTMPEPELPEITKRDIFNSRIDKLIYRDDLVDTPTQPDPKLSQPLDIPRPKKKDNYGWPIPIPEPIPEPIYMYPDDLLAYTEAIESSVLATVPDPNTESHSQHEENTQPKQEEVYVKPPADYSSVKSAKSEKVADDHELPQPLASASMSKDDDANSVVYDEEEEEEEGVESDFEAEEEKAAPPPPQKPRRGSMPAALPSKPIEAKKPPSESSSKAPTPSSSKKSSSGSDAALPSSSSDDEAKPNPPQAKSSASDNKSHKSAKSNKSHKSNKSKKSHYSYREEEEEEEEEEEIIEEDVYEVED